MSAYEIAMIIIASMTLLLKLIQVIKDLIQKKVIENHRVLRIRGGLVHHQQVMCRVDHSLPLLYAFQP